MTQSRHKLALGTSLLLTGACLVNLAYAESLFRAGIAYQASQPFTPKSLFAVPRPVNVGDIVTININEVTQVGIQNNMTVQRSQELTENSTNFFNDLINRVFKRPANRQDILPTPNGISNDHQINMTARSQKQYSYQDAITCQVVQVLPNGNLVVQGRKSILANQEQQNLYVTGIVNPYYLDTNNSINSEQVANLQMSVSGKGPITRQQGDGVIGKYFQFFN